MVTEINWSNVTSLTQIPSLANTVSGNTFWVGMLQMIWIVTILILIAWGWEIALLVASFIGLIMALLLVYGGLVSWVYIVQFTAIILFMILYIVWSGKKFNQT